VHPAIALRRSSLVKQTTTCQASWDPRTVGLATHQMDATNARGVPDRAEGRHFNREPAACDQRRAAQIAEKAGPLIVRDRHRPMVSATWSDGCRADGPISSGAGHAVVTGECHRGHPAVRVRSLAPQVVAHCTEEIDRLSRLMNLPNTIEIS
jgi:hypothetical protein